MKKWIPLLIILVLTLTVYFSGLTDTLSFATLKHHRENLLLFKLEHPVLLPFLYMALYIVTISLSLPGAAILSLFGGFLFGLPMSTIYVLISATIGATVIFLAARSAFGDLLKKKAGAFLSKMEHGFRKNATSYLLFLRFIPLFPFWAVNLTPAFFNVRIWTFIWTTFVGIIPGAYVYTQAGSGLGAIFETGANFSVQNIFNAEIKIALVLLGLFSLIPIFVKTFMRKKNDR